MALSRLPPELRIRIAQELNNDRTETARQSGRDLALVSRDWRDIGTAIVWETLDLSWSKPDFTRRVAHMRSNPHLYHFVSVVDLDLDCQPSGEYLDQSYESLAAEEDRSVALNRFATEVFPNLTQLRKLTLNAEQLHTAYIPLSASYDTGRINFPRLEEFKYSFGTAELEETRFGIRPIEHLFRILPDLASLKSLDLRLSTASEAVPPPIPEPPPLQSLENLRIDLAPCESFLWDEDDGPTDVELEPVLLYLLSLPCPTRLRTLYVSATFIEHRSLSALKAFTSLTSLTLHFVPDNLEDLVDSLPSLVASFPLLERLELLATHDHDNIRAVRISPVQLERFLAAVPPTLVALTTHFDLGHRDGEQGTRGAESPCVDLVLEWITSRSEASAPLESFAYYDARYERLHFGDRAPSTGREFVLVEHRTRSARDPKAGTGAAPSGRNPRHYSLMDDLRYR
ncbi:hypothetical protein JCM11491_002589 [Sporobolomyces phaffii]